jgi:lipoate-protein ligase B
METAPTRSSQPPATALQVVRPGRIGYADALARQRAAADALRAGTGPEVLFLLEHPPVVTLGRRAKDDGHLLLSREQLESRGFEVVETDRGGDVTYHGPGQIVGYPIFDLRRRRSGPRAHLHYMEEVLIGVLTEHYGIDAFRDPDHTGVWTPLGKIAAMGIRVSNGVSLHGFALNVERDLAGFGVIVPCGIQGRAVATMAGALGEAPPMDEVMDHLEEAFRRTS